MVRQSSQVGQLTMHQILWALAWLQCEGVLRRSVAKEPSPTWYSRSLDSTDFTSFKPMEWIHASDRVEHGELEVCPFPRTRLF